MQAVLVSSAAVLQAPTRPMCTRQIGMCLCMCVCVEVQAPTTHQVRERSTMYARRIGRGYGGAEVRCC